MLAKRMDELEARIAELAKEEEIAALRPEMDGAAVMEFLGVKPGRQVGAALDFLMEIRLEEGVLGDDEIRRRLNEWWTSQTK
jgi:poly(A) polymerase